MRSAGYQLGIDFGTSNTVAMLAGPDGRVRPLLFGVSPLLSSGVFAAVDGGLLTGVNGEHAAVSAPAGWEPNPKQCVDHGTVWLAERSVPVVDLIAAVLRTVAGEAARVAGGPPGAVVLTHPSAWGNVRCGILLDPSSAVAGAAVQAGLLTGKVLDLLLLDVAPMSLSVETAGGGTQRLIERNTTIPTLRRHLFTTGAAGQSAVRVRVLEGEHAAAADNRRLLTIDITGIPPAPAGCPASRSSSTSTPTASCS
ncbi:Hsp70 family protein [Dactylosporangium siamense]|uniref:Hsp70 family protein n=1 Tax=Dactylosporangium siamense TaxID=685454 RepID=UPI00194466C4|nr:Hsp70 family protein [Dactylosporangium siamense]